MKPLSEEGLAFWREVIGASNEASKPKKESRSAKVDTDSGRTTLIWRVMCEHCRWVQDHVDTRAEAIRLGRNHVHEEHEDDPEWEFRVQGLKH